MAPICRETNHKWPKKGTSRPQIQKFSLPGRIPSNLGEKSFSKKKVKIAIFAEKNAIFAEVAEPRGLPTALGTFFNCDSMDGKKFSALDSKRFPVFSAPTPP